MRPELVPPVDGRGLDWPRKVANAIKYLVADNIGLNSRVADLDAAGAAGFGFIDYTDTQIGTRMPLPSGTATQVRRNLTASPANSQLQGPFAGHVFWDNDTDTIRSRALFDVFDLSIALRVVPGASGGTLDVAIMAGTIEVGLKTLELNGPVGVEKGMRVDFKIATRASLLANGGKVVLTPSVASELAEFSPEFFPQSFKR